MGWLNKLKHTVICFLEYVVHFKTQCMKVINSGHTKQLSEKWHHNLRSKNTLLLMQKYSQLKFTCRMKTVLLNKQMDEEGSVNKHLLSNYQMYTLCYMLWGMSKKQKTLGLQEFIIQFSLKNSPKKHIDKYKFKRHLTKSTQ